MDRRSKRLLSHQHGAVGDGGVQWWREIEGWTARIIAGMVDLWPKAATVIEEGLQEP